LAAAMSLQAVLCMQDSLSSAPEVYMRKHMPPVRSVSVMELSSEERAVDPDPAKTMPAPRMRPFNTSKMIKLVKLRVKTSDVEVALAINSMAVGTSADSSMALAPAKTAAITAVPYKYFILLC